MVESVQVYNNAIIEKFANESSHITSLGHIAIKDSGQTFGLPTDVLAFDVDSFEASRDGENVKTIDAIIGIADYVRNCVKNERALLVELRTNYKKEGRHSTIDDMLRKERYTRSLMSCFPLDQRCFFIFTNEVAPRKKHEINQRSKTLSSLRLWEIVNPSEFLQKFHYIKDLPYTPKSPLDEIYKKLAELYKLGKIEELLRELHYWFRQLKIYFDRYDNEECVRLIHVLIKYVQLALENLLNDVSEDLQLEYMILDEDLNRIQKSLCQRMII